MQTSETARAARSQNAYAGIARILDNRKKRRIRWHTEARQLWEQWHTDPLFLLGIGLYWGEGAKSPRACQLRISNSDVNLLRVWLAWCQRFLPGVPLYNGINLHPNCDAETARRFWEEQLQIKIGYIWVSTSKASGRKRNTLPHGTLNIRVGRGSLEWYTKMMVRLEMAHELPFPAPADQQVRIEVSRDNPPSTS